MARRGARAAGSVPPAGRSSSPCKADRIDTQTDALMDLAEVLRIAGARAKLADVVEDALRRYEHKEVLPPPSEHASASPSFARLRSGSLTSSRRELPAAASRRPRR